MYTVLAGALMYLPCIVRPMLRGCTEYWTIIYCYICSFVSYTF
jgi:hypothetical protein